MQEKCIAEGTDVKKSLRIRGAGGGRGPCAETPAAAALRAAFAKVHRCSGGGCAQRAKISRVRFPGLARRGGNV